MPTYITFIKTTRNICLIQQEKTYLRVDEIVNTSITIHNKIIAKLSSYRIVVQ